MIINGLINLHTMPIVVRKLNNPIMLADISKPDLYLVSSILMETKGKFGIYQAILVMVYHFMFFQRFLLNIH